MEVYERIKNRRKQLGMSAEQVADIIGVSPATVYRYESNYIENMGLNKLEPISKALQTTPSYLMGWTDEVNAPLQHSDIYTFSQKEIALIEKYRNCSHIAKEKIDRYIDNIYELEQAESAVTQNTTNDPFAECRDEEAIKQYVVTPNPAAANE